MLDYNTNFHVWDWDQAVIFSILDKTMEHQNLLSRYQNSSRSTSQQYISRKFIFLLKINPNKLDKMVITFNLRKIDRKTEAIDLRDPDAVSKQHDKEGARAFMAFFVDQMSRREIFTVRDTTLSSSKFRDV